MKQNLDNPLHILNDPKLGFTKLKGSYVLDYECIMTKFQLVGVLKEYILVEFLEDYEIRHRTVMFWHASVNHGKLKIIVYDINNDDIILKTYDINKDSNSYWFLYDEQILNDELTDFMNTFFQRIPAPKGEQISE